MIQNDSVIDEQNVSFRVVQRVATQLGESPTALPPIADVINPDALDALFQQKANGSQHVIFDYAETRVTVSGGGEIQVVALEEIDRGEEEPRSQ